MSINAREIMLCAISNIQSGNCAEDCAFCAQSAHVHADIPTYKLKSVDEILFEAKRAKSVGALGFCLVTSGKSIDEKKVRLACEATKAIESEVGGLFIIACLGVAGLDELKELKKYGVRSYNHNLESAESFYPTLCSSISWNERYRTAQNAKSAGLDLCCGGIFGLGESDAQRDEFLKALKSLNPHSSPMNFFQSNEALKIKHDLMDVDEALGVLKKARVVLDESIIMVAGGREATFKDRQKEMLACGVDAIVIGDYLTAKGEEPSSDIEMLNRCGYRVATNCY